MCRLRGFCFFNIFDSNICTNDMKEIRFSYFKIILLMILVSACMAAHGQLYFALAGAGLNSKTFGQYANHVNQGPNVKQKLGNFGPSAGYSIGLELPGKHVTGSFLAFNYRHFRSSASMELTDLGVVNYKLRLNQYLIPAGIGKIEIFGKTYKATLINIIVGLSSSKLDRNYENNSSSDLRLKRTVANVGLGTSIIRVKGPAGYIVRAAYIGNLLPRYDDQLALRNGSNYLKYRFEGETRELKADVRGVHIEAGIFLNLRG